MKLKDIEREIQKDLHSQGYVLDLITVKDILRTVINVYYRNIVAGKKVDFGRVGHFVSNLREYKNKLPTTSESTQKSFKRWIISFKSSRPIKDDINEPIKNG